MSWKYLRKDDHGQVGKLTFIDVDTDAAADVSSYTTAQKMIFTKPDGTEVEKTAAFDGDGSDGVIAYTIEEDLLDVGGDWEVHGQVQSGSAVLTTERHSFTVLE